uniref:Uncharacterized protein n=1 Tax=Rhizophora mucronata TaxID=61149 RepID=A0A2P2NPF6_RHIMU
MVSYRLSFILILLADTFRQAHELN